MTHLNRRALSLFLAAVLLLTALVSCSEKAENPEEVSQQNPSAVEENQIGRAHV